MKDRTTTRRSSHPATGAQGKPSTGRATRGMDRPRRMPSSRKSNTPIIIGACVGGGLLLVVLIAVIASGGSGGGAATSTSGGSTPEARPVDVSGLVAQGETKCEQGCAIIQECEGLMTRETLSAAEKSTLREKLEKGTNLIHAGMQMLEEAQTKSNGAAGGADIRYGKTYKAARMKLLELK